MSRRVRSARRAEVRYTRITMDPGPRIVASWLWAVVNPQIEHCGYERDLLATTLTFRAHNQAFERLKPLRQALLPEGRQIFDDLRGEIPEYDKAVGRHDQTLNELHRRAAKLFDVLVSGPDLERSLAQRLREPANAGVLEQSVDTTEEIAEVTRYIAAYIVNDLNELPQDYSLSRLWNSSLRELKKMAPTDLARALHDEREEFKHVLDETETCLATLRKGWSRKYDIPVAYVPGIRFEASPD